MIIGIILGILFTLFVGGMMYFFYLLGKKSNKNIDDIDSKKLHLMKLREEGFQNVMTYDYDVALGRRMSGE